ncbi:MAG: type II toxin-antitoxin system prevent-host-death family antitoxin [Gemmatimonadetes bacterium]|nr:type II toxin-antitoxin system prevent-host-death family antitoxin [Gemmatimonadota bacterium]
MEQMTITEFKARCIAVLKEVQASGRPLVVTLRGRPLARVEPAGTDPDGPRLGVREGDMKIRGDIVSCDFTDEWEMER